MPAKKRFPTWLPAGLSVSKNLGMLTANFAIRETREGLSGHANTKIVEKIVTSSEKTPPIKNRSVDCRTPPMIRSFLSMMPGTRMKLELSRMIRVIRVAVLSLDVTVMS